MAKVEAKGISPGQRHTRGGAHQVLLGDAHVEAPVRVYGAELIQGRGFLQIRRQGDDPVVVFGHLRQGAP